MLLKDRTAIVYGGSGAVGGAVAKAFAREGARVFVAARQAEPLQAVTAAIAAAGGEAHYASVDVTDAAAVAEHIATVAKAAGPVRLVFNAVEWGHTQGEELINMSYAKFGDHVGKALQSWFVVGTSAARHMAANGGGSIMGITANAAREPYAMVGGFGTACAGVEHFLRQLGVENGPAGVRTCWVRSAGSPDAPGVREAFTLRANERGITLEAFEREAGAGAPLRHLPALAEVADAAVILASDYARGMTATFANVTCGAQVD